jgi:hypothetical protein
VDTVVIPYLNSHDMFMILGGALVRQRCPPDLVTQVTDPESWFRRFGVRRVIRLRPPPAPPGPAGEPDTREPPPFPNPPKDRPTCSQPQIAFLDPAGIELRGDVARAGTIAGVNTGAGWADWWFIPFVHPVARGESRHLYRAVRDEINRKARGRTFQARLRNLLRTQAGRSLLKKQYTLHNVGDANAISLSLYEGPYPNGQNAAAADQLRTGWLLTGDAELQKADRRRQWLNFFHPCKSRIGFLMLPHHGSIHNFHADILTAAEAHAKLFITADARDKTRPNREVQTSACRRIHKVSERGNSAMIEFSGPNFTSEFRSKLRNW